MALFVKQKWNYRFNCAIVYWCVLLDNSVQKKISSKECPLWFCSVNNPKSLSIKSLIAAILCKEWEFFPCCSHLNWTTNNEPWNSTGKMSYIFNFLLPCKIQNNAWIKFNLFNLNQITNFEMFWILFSTLPLSHLLYPGLGRVFWVICYVFFSPGSNFLQNDSCSLQTLAFMSRLILSKYLIKELDCSLN